MKTPTITLTTDFGLSDEYVGVMKGVILSRCPTAVIVDITHQIRPQDIRRAALLLAATHRFFPVGTIHVVVVDPGVGTSRRIVLIEVTDQFFLLPDNGACSLLPAPQAAWEVTEKHLFLQPVSPTFHGRDIFAPVAAALAGGLSAAHTGPAIDPAGLTRLALPTLHIEANELCGAVIDIDHFGNLITNIDRASAKAFSRGELDRLTVTVGSQIIPTISLTYGSNKIGEAVALFGSRDLLEIGINRGNAAARLGIDLDSAVRVRRSAQS
ncbi:MAG: SAM hydrolase/SAM-dependent halogenase family protein [Thermodesulfobacteriota bacterium]